MDKPPKTGYAPPRVPTGEIHDETLPDGRPFYEEAEEQLTWAEYFPSAKEWVKVHVGAELTSEDGRANVSSAEQHNRSC